MDQLIIFVKDLRKKKWRLNFRPEDETHLHNNGGGVAVEVGRSKFSNPD